MERLVDFLNHGSLPFAGRTSEGEALLACWRRAIEAQELHTVLVAGEAGVGKSRLLDETIPRIENAGGTVVRAKLFAESGASAIPMIAEALWYHEETRRLLRSERVASTGAVAAQLRRIVRLRPTMLVIEDIHLLAGDAVREFGGLLNALGEEPLALVCTARPSNLGVRPLLERYVVNEIMLEGLTKADVEEIWNLLFDKGADGNPAAILFEATGGNPLAVRSALRSAIKSGAVHQDPLTHRWAAAGSPEAYRRILLRSVELLAEGMATGLDDEERVAAERLAWLGEAFAHESADMVASAGERMIDRLQFKGVLYNPPASIPALAGEPSRLPLLAFTHSLLHQHLIATSKAPVELLLRTIAADGPLYSILPIQAARAGIASLDVPPEHLRGFFERALALARQLDLGPTWHEALGIWEAAQAAFTRLTDELAPHERTVLHARLLNRRLSLMRRSIDPGEYESIVGEILRITEGAADIDVLEQRLGALRYLLAVRMHAEEANDADIWEQVTEIVRQRPELRTGRAYLLFVRDAANQAARIADITTLRRIEARVQEVLSLRELPPALRTLALHQIVPHFLQIFDSPEELTRRHALLDGVSAISDGGDAHFLIHRITFLESTGHYADVVSTAERGLEIFGAAGLARNIFQCELSRQCARAAFGMPLAAVEQELARICGAARGDLATSFRRTAAVYLTESGLLRGDAAWTRHINERFAPDEPLYWPAGYLILGALDGDVPAAAERFLRMELHEPGEQELARLVLACTNEPGETATAARIARRLLEGPLLRTNDLVTLHAVLTLLSTSTKLSAAVRADAAAGITKGLEWLSERGLGGYMTALAERADQYLTKRDAAHWRAEARRLIEREGYDAAEETTRRIHVRMLGTVAVETPGGGLTPIRGARLRTVLGLLTAARMVSKPLTNNEFCRLAAGGEQDIDLARKTMNMAITRLREAIGAEAIITGAETHVLNDDVVDVDLLEADRLLREAAGALRRRSLPIAFPAAMRVLEISRGEVPFPGLYDDFFEALREDFENRVRTTVLDVARALVLEADNAGAARLLQRAFDALPDDEEIAELLRLTLTALDDRTAAERVRMRAEEASEP